MFLFQFYDFFLSTIDYSTICSIKKEFKKRVRSQHIVAFKFLVCLDNITLRFNQTTENDKF